MVWASAGGPISVVASYRVVSLFFRLILVFGLRCQLFSLVSGCCTACGMGVACQCGVVVVPEEGWFGRPRCGAPKKIRILLRCVDFCFYFLHFICEADYITIDPTYSSGIIVLVACLNVVILQLGSNDLIGYNNRLPSSVLPSQLRSLNICLFGTN